MIKRGILASLFTLIVMMVIYILNKMPLSNEEAMDRFFNDQVAEDQLMDPLILSGDRILSMLHVEVVNPNMKRRRYAIGALGNLGSTSSIPVLESIYLSEFEKNYFRCDAIGSIANIDITYAQEIVKDAYESAAPCLKMIHNSVKESACSNEKCFYMKRSFYDAFFGKHN